MRVELTVEELQTLVAAAIENGYVIPTKEKANGAVDDRLTTKAEYAGATEPNFVFNIYTKEEIERTAPLVDVNRQRWI